MNAPVVSPSVTLDPELLRSFVAISETGSFTAAAEKVFRTPSAVSMQIKRLEDVLGVSVFTRDARNVSLTPDGEILLNYARRLLALNRETMSRFVSADVSGVVRIGAPSDYGEVILPPALKRFGASHPQVMVDVVIDRSHNLTQMFAARKIDIALVSCYSEAERSAHEAIMTDDIVWAGAKGGQAYLQNPLPVSLWDETCSWRTSAIKSLDSVGRAYRVAFKTAHVAGQRAAILADLAVAPMGRSFIADDLQVLGEESGLPSMGTYDLVLQVDNKAAPQVSEFADHLHSIFAHFREHGKFSCC